MEINGDGLGCGMVLAVLAVLLFVIGGLVAIEMFRDTVTAHAEAEIVQAQEQTARLVENNMHREWMYAAHAATMAALRDHRSEIGIGFLLGAIVAGTVAWTSRGWLERNGAIRPPQ